MRAEFLRDKFGSKSMSRPVPVRIPSEIASESVQKNLVLFGIGLHGLSQIQKVNLFARSQSFQSLVWIEHSAHANALHKILTHDRVGIDLDLVAESYDDKLLAALPDFIAHLNN